MRRQFLSAFDIANISSPLSGALNRLAMFAVKFSFFVENGMGVSIGRLREDTVYDYKFIGLAHNTVRGAAGGAILCAELLTAKGFIAAK